MTTSPRDLNALATLLPDADGAHLAALLRHHGGLHGLLVAPVGELVASGMDMTDARRLGAVRRLCVRLMRRRRRRRLSTPSHVARLLPHLGWHPQEEVWAIPVDCRQRVLGPTLVARGDAASCAVSAGEVLAVGLRHRARGLFVVHNHPSGDPRPSPADILFTERLVAAAKLLSLRIEDHLVVANGRFSAIISRRRGSVGVRGLRPPSTLPTNQIRTRPSALKSQRHRDAARAPTEGRNRDADQRRFDAGLERRVVARLDPDRDAGQTVGRDGEPDVGPGK